MKKIPSRETGWNFAAIGSIDSMDYFHNVPMVQGTMLTSDWKWDDFFTNAGVNMSLTSIK